MQRLRHWPSPPPHAGYPLPDPAQHHAAKLALDTLSCFQDASVCRDEHALSGVRQALDVVGLACPRDFGKVLRGEPYAARRLGDELHVLQHGLVLPVLEAEPKPSPGRVFWDVDVVDVLLEHAWRRRPLRVVCRVGQPGLPGKGAGHLVLLLGAVLCLQLVGLGRGLAAEGDGGEEALALQAEGEVNVHLGNGDRGESEPGLGCVLQVRAHVGEVDEGHGGGGDGAEGCSAPRHDASTSKPSGGTGRAQAMQQAPGEEAAVDSNGRW